MALEPGAQRTFGLSSRTPRIPFNVLSRTIVVIILKFKKYNKTNFKYFQGKEALSILDTSEGQSFLKLKTSLPWK